MMKLTNVLNFCTILYRQNLYVFRLKVESSSELQNFIQNLKHLRMYQNSLIIGHIHYTLIRIAIIYRDVQLLNIRGLSLHLLFDA